MQACTPAPMTSTRTLLASRQKQRWSDPRTAQVHAYPWPRKLPVLAKYCTILWVAPAWRPCTRMSGVQARPSIQWQRPMAMRTSILHARMPPRFVISVRAPRSKPIEQLVAAHVVSCVSVAARHVNAYARAVFHSTCWVGWPERG